jgi:hypothetical protein
MVKDFLPISREDMKKRGWQQCDFVYICGDAYVDHSSFGMAIITRLLERLALLHSLTGKRKNQLQSSENQD